MPAALDAAPDLPPGLDWYVEAFLALASCRPQGMAGPGPIPWTALDRYAQRHGIAGAEFEIFEVLIAALDSAWLGWRAEREGKLP